MRRKRKRQTLAAWCEETGFTHEEAFENCLEEIEELASSKGTQSLELFRLRKLAGEAADELCYQRLPELAPLALIDRLRTAEKGGTP